MSFSFSNIKIRCLTKRERKILKGNTQLKLMFPCMFLHDYLDTRNPWNLILFFTYHPPWLKLIRGIYHQSQFTLFSVTVSTIYPLLSIREGRVTAAFQYLILRVTVDSCLTIVENSNLKITRLNIST